jgi:outer membrane protein OmpA-like peptidoglycan-associated protein
MRRGALVASLGMACAVPRGAAVTGQLESELLAARQRLSHCEAAATTCADDAPPAAAYRELRAVLAPGEVEVLRAGATTALLIPTDLLFGGDGLRVRAEATMVLDLLGTALRLHPELRATITAHADPTAASPGAELVGGDALALTTTQARQVLTALRDQHGVPARQLVAAGQGDAAPLLPGETPLEQARNRRVVVVLAMPPSWDRPDGAAVR